MKTLTEENVEGILKTHFPQHTDEPPYHSLLKDLKAFDVINSDKLAVILKRRKTEIIERESLNLKEMERALKNLDIKRDMPHRLPLQGLVRVGLTTFAKRTLDQKFSPPRVKRSYSY